MTKFDEIRYIRPDYEKLKEKASQVAEEIRKAPDFETVLLLLQDFQKEYDRVETMMSVAVIGSYSDMTDEKVGEEAAYCWGNSNAFDSSPVYEAIAEGPFKKDFDEKYGPFLLESMLNKKSLYKGGEEFLVKEQEILSQIQNYVSNILFEYEGELLPESKISVLRNSDDEAVKKKARYAYRKGYADNGEKVGEYLGQLVEVRDKIAKANGYKNYLEYSNISKNRFSYGEPEFDEFCSNVRKYFIPLVQRNNEKLKKLLKLDVYTNDDTGRFFADGNAKPEGDVAAIKEKFQKAFDDMDPMFGATFSKMMENGYIDLEPSDTKPVSLSFAQEMFSERIPYVFSNYLGEDKNITTIFHECGHALQMQLSMDKYDLHELYDQSQDLSELPSKTMEMFSHAYAKLFFGEGADKYVYQHLNSFFDTITDFCMLHEFETFLYTETKATPQERIDKFNELTRLYSPGITYLYPELMDKGCILYSNSNMFNFVRYGISYALSDFSAVHLAIEFKKDKKKGAQLFKKLGEIGGTMDYNEAISYLGLKPAFSEEVIKEVAGYFEKELVL